MSQVVSVSDLDHTPGAGFMAFGSFVFDPATTAARSTMVVPRTVLGRRNGRAWLTQIGTSFVHDDSLPQVSPPLAPRNISYADGGLTGPQWEAAVAEAVRRITAGDLEKVVLARDLLARAAEPIDPRWILARLAERYERCWSYLVDGLVGATPEMLLRRENGPGHLAGAGRHHPAQRRQHPRPGLRGGAGPVQQGPGGARVRGGARWRTRWRRTAPG